MITAGEIWSVYLENLVLVALEAVQFELEVPEVPEGHGLVGGAGGEDELGVRVETETVNLSTTELISLNNIRTTTTNSPQQCGHPPCGRAGW